LSALGDDIFLPAVFGVLLRSMENGYVDIHRIEQTAPERVVLADHPQPKGVSLDGGMVNIRQEGWKDVKVGTVYDIELRSERDADTAELVELPHAINLAYTAVLGDVHAFAPALWHVAVQQGVPTTQESSVTADGTEWIGIS
jgi:hypothetical protein